MNLSWLPSSRAFCRGLFFLFWISSLHPTFAEETGSVKPANADAETGVSQEAYLAPLRAAADEAAFIETLESMGDLAIIRLETLRDQLRSGQVPGGDAEAVQGEVRELLSKLEWLADIALARYAENAKVRNFRGNILYDYFGKQVEAVKEWHTAISLDSDYGEPYNNLGMHYFHVGRYPLGFQNMDKALDLEPDNPDFCYNMAQNYLIFGPQTEEKRGWASKRVYKEAMKLSKRATKNAPDDYELLEDYAVNFLAAENFGVKADWKDAARAWQEARKYAPGDIKRFYTWLNEGRAWLRAGKHDDARRCFEEARKILPENDVVKRLLEEVEKADA